MRDIIYVFEFLLFDIVSNFSLLNVHIGSIISYNV